ncbi:MAG: hypothetical protein DI601_12290 [Azospirillum brasilense]|nr:MAG: hypothetical protein DI601_12290 [Azospirillum brasilense]
MAACPRTLTDLEADPLAVIAEGREADPFLSWKGIIRPIDRVIDRDATARHAACRAEMTSSRCVAQFLRAARFIEQAPPSRRINRRRSTYGWKHVAERFHKAMDPSGDCYVGEGMFILAARAMGLMVHVDRHEDTYVNLSERAATPWGDSGDGAAP